MNDKVHHTIPFGQIPCDRIASVTLESASQLRQEILERSMSNADVGQYHQNEEFLKILDDYRTEVGALWLQLSKQLDADIEKSHYVSGRFWMCMWASLVQRQLRPQKYRALCGTPSKGYGGLVTYLANVPAQDYLVKRWQVETWKEHVDRIWRTKNQLIEKEKEFRDIAVAVAQIGIGMGGMLLGLIGLILSLIAAAIL